MRSYISLLRLGLLLLVLGSGACARPVPAAMRGPLLDQLFAPPTAEELAAVAAEWARRDVSARDVRVEWRDERSDGTRTLVLSHTVGGLRHYGAVRIPPGAEGRRLPVLLVAHGGDRGTSPLQLFREGPLASGWVQVLPSFRSERLYMGAVRWYRSQGSPSLWDRDVDDALALLNATLQQVPEADSARIAVLGRSRGGGVALLMAIRDPRIDAVVDYFGPTDFLLPEVRKLAGRALQTRLPRLPGAGYLADSVLFALRDGRITAAEARLQLVRRSPAYFAERLPPTLIHQGSEDDKVPPAHGERLLDALARLGRAGERWPYHLYPGGGHHERTLPRSRRRTEEFLQRVVAGDDPGRRSDMIRQSE